MTSPDVSTRSFVLFSSAILGWIVWLSFALKLLLGAQMTGGWIVIGIMFTVMAIGVLLIINELSMAFAGLRLRDWKIFHPSPKVARTKKAKPRRRTVTPRTVKPKQVARRTTAQSYRIALGLKPRIPSINRRRTKLFWPGRALRWQRI